MLIFALALAAPTSLTDNQQRDIACVVELAIIADEQQRGIAVGSGFPDVRVDGKRWAGIVGARIVEESGQPRELVAVAMTEAAKARPGLVRDDVEVTACITKMTADLAMAYAAGAPLPKPVKAQ